MKKARTNWKKKILTDRLIRRLSNIYFEEYDWELVWQTGYDEDPVVLASLLKEGGIISVVQFQEWAARKEWGPKK